MNMILLGYRGSGKTSVGRQLADQLWKTFADSDTETCKRFNGKTIREIWEEHGEPAWRSAEAEVVRELVKRPEHVVALGGGSVMIPGLADELKAAPGCRRIYLRCEPAELHRRIVADTASAATRPSLTALGGSVEEVARVLAEREPTYRAVADAEFDVTHVNVEDAVRYVIQRCL